MNHYKLSGKSIYLDIDMKKCPCYIGKWKKKKRVVDTATYIIPFLLLKRTVRDFPGGQWLRLQAPNAGGPV